LKTNVGAAVCNSRLRQSLTIAQVAEHAEISGGILSNSVSPGPGKLFVYFMVSIDRPAKSLPSIEHPGVEIIHLLEGQVECRLGQDVFAMKPGDTLT
jgi:quercetin dioxygenase-like cupin family protein